MKILNKTILFLLISFFVLACSHLLPVEAGEKEIKVGVVVSALSEEYAFIERPGGYNHGVYIMPKSIGSSIKNKRIKTKILLESLGYEVAYINDQQLSNVNELKKYDTVFFPNTVMMSKQQREAVRKYIKDGGGAIFAFAFARNESAHFPYKDTDLDLTPLIYDTKTWIWEWDNVSELFQSAFVNDVMVGNAKMTSTGNHPIVKNTKKQIGTSEVVIQDMRYNMYGPTWIEVINPYPNSYVTPLLQYSYIGYSSVPKHTPIGTGAAYAIEYGKGKAVWFGFQPLNYIAVPNERSNEWDVQNPKGRKEVRGEAWDGLIGGDVLKVFLDESVKWTSHPLDTFHSINRDVSIRLSDVRAYPRANDYVVYATMTSKNEGNVITRGTMTVQLIDPSGKVKDTYEKYIVGIIPLGASYPEKIQLFLPKNPVEGNYRLVATYHTGRRNKDGLSIAADSKIISITNNRSQATIKDGAVFSDVSSSFWAKKDINHLFNLGIFNGYKNGTFRPNQPITRLEAATVLVRSLGLSTKNRPDPKLVDVKPGQEGYDIIATVVDQGIFSGSNGYFRANNPLTREQMAKILVNAYQLTGTETVSFKDVELNRWSYPYISVLKANKVTNVQEHFRPTEKTTRAQFAAFVRRSMLMSHFTQ
ncbi:MAG: S-layer homology domain-containing protein [Bacillus sp. (in: Bacteria)]|nr:S-layer homology domain-containing protein [Bacillus sp. (in: firmicutes)]